MSNESKKPSGNVSALTSKLRAQIEQMKRVSPTSHKLTLTLTGPVFRAMQTIADQAEDSVPAVAANILSGWVAQQHEEYAAQRQKEDDAT